jgi:hypothetical protein
VADVVERDGALGEVDREFVRPLDIQAHADDDEGGGRPIRLGEDAGQLAVVGRSVARPHQIVRPLDPRVDAGDSFDCFRRGDAGQHGAEAGDGRRRAEQHGHEQRRTGRRRPHAAAAPASRRLVVGYEDDPLGRSGAGQSEQVVVRRTGLRHPADVREPGAAELLSGHCPGHAK